MNEAGNDRRIAERREADQRSGEDRRIDNARRNWNRRYDAPGATPGVSEFDRRGVHPSLFAMHGFKLLRGIRRTDSARRNDEGRRFFMRRCVERRAL